MGKMICPRHGPQLFAFVSARIAAQTKGGLNATDEPIYALKLRWLDHWFVCPVHAHFLAENSIGIPTSSRTVAIDDEDASEGLLAKLSGSCRVCLDDYLQSSPQWAEIATAVEEQFRKY